ncbi:MAG: ABC transporter permease [Candidatus Acidiferrales bacterium]
MPDWKPEILRRLAPLKLSTPREAEIAEELAQHLDDRYQELLAAGEAEDAAYRTSLGELKDEDFLARNLKRVERNFYREPVAVGKGSGNLFSGIFQDVRYALRMLRKSPGFAAVAILTLALGIGANTAIFSVVNAVLLRALPYRMPSQIVMVFWSNPAWGQDRIPLCVADFDDWKALNHAFVEPTVFGKNLYDYTSSQEPQQIAGAGVSPGFFSTLGVEPTLGRGFLPEEEKPGGRLAVIVSQNFWVHNLHGDAQAIGRNITLDGQSYVVVGVMPGSFRFPSESVELWEPLRLKPPTRRGPYFLRGLARLRPGVSPQQARADMAAVSERIREETHAQDTGGAPNVMPL